jgi:hypothetical protein
MESKICKNCDNWERDGGDGICRGGMPRPVIIESGKSFNLVWPRTRGDERCGDWKPFMGELQ